MVNKVTSRGPHVFENRENPIVGIGAHSIYFWGNLLTIFWFWQQLTFLVIL